MAHIDVPPGRPGINGLMARYPETAKHLNALADALLRGASSLTPAEREIIGTVVSAGNECTFCTNVHASVARHLLGSEGVVVDQVLAAPDAAPLDPRLRALLVIAEKVRRGGRLVTAEDVARARAHGADDRAIHDTVLIAAAFCMFNRYVDGLATSAPAERAAYEGIGALLAATGYRPTQA